MAKQRQMEHKQFDAYVTDVNEDKGEITAIFSVFGNVDEGYDRIHPGAFAKTFAERGHKVLVLDNHNMMSAGDAVAKVKSLRELGRDELPAEVLLHYPEATGGAEIVAQFEPDPAADMKSAGVFYRLKNQWIKEWSFGYDALDFDFTDEDIEGRKARIRNLRGLKLYEVSPVLLGMNTATMTTGAKAMEGKPYRVVEEGGKYEVYKLDADGEPTGASLGTHETEAEAEAQIRALYANEGEDEGKEKDKDKAAEQPETAKAGRVLSTRNATRIMDAMNLLHEALRDAGLMMDEGEPDNDEMGKNLNTPPTSNEAGPDGNKSEDYLNLLQIEQHRLLLLEV